MREEDYKPSSVPPAGGTVIYLVRTVARRINAAYPEIIQDEPIPISLFGLAPDGVYPRQGLP